MDHLLTVTFVLNLTRLYTWFVGGHALAGGQGPGVLSGVLGRAAHSAVIPGVVLREVLWGFYIS